jgi:hypothetical protein
VLAQMQLHRPREICKRLHNPIKPLHLARQNIDMPLRPAKRLRAAGNQLALQQLQMHHHRIDRVLHLVPHARCQPSNRRQPPRYLKLLSQLRRRFNIAQSDQSPHIAAAQPIVDSVQRDLDVPPIFKRHTFRTYLPFIGKRLEHCRSQRTLRIKDLLQPFPDHPLMPQFTHPRQKVCHSIRHHHGTPIGRK